MPKIKLKPHLNAVEVGLGNLIDLKFAPGEEVDVTDEIAKELLAMDHFELADRLSTVGESLIYDDPLSDD